MVRTYIRLTRHFFQKFCADAPNRAYNLLLYLQSTLDTELGVSDMFTTLDDGNVEEADAIAESIKARCPDHPSLTVYKYEKTYQTTERS